MFPQYLPVQVNLAKYRLQNTVCRVMSPQYRAMYDMYLPLLCSSPSSLHGQALLSVDFSHCEDGYYSPSLMDTLLVTPLLLIVLLIVPAGLLASGLLVFFFRRRLREMIKDVRW
jgi:hypothetical protein